jgi:hypothetical protein
MALNNKSNKLNIEDDLFKIKLKNHQKALLYKTIEIDKNYCNSKFPFGLISDKPGSGKTYVVLALIYHLIEYFNSKGPNVIVVPQNIFSQWVTSIKTLLGKKLKYKCLTEYKDINQLNGNARIIYEYDIILITPLHYNSLATTLQQLNMGVQRVFFDEADTMKNLMVSTIPTNMHWFISATITQLFDNYTQKAKIGQYELYLPHLIKNNCYCDNDFIDKNIKLPKPIEENFYCVDFYIDNILCNTVHDFMDSLNNHDYSKIKKECDISNMHDEKDVLKGLYKYCVKIIESTNMSIKDCENKLKNCNNNDRINYTDVLQRYQNQNSTYKNRFGNIKNLCISNCICVKCFKRCVENFINIGTYNDIIAHVSECNNYICVECMEENDNKNKGILKEKINVFCEECNTNHLKDSYKTDCINLSKKYIKQYNKEKYTKNYVLEELINICDDKIIIYCENANISFNIKKITDKLNIDFEELNGGNRSKIDEILNNFKTNNKIKILIIDNAIMTVGMNLEFVNNIIIYSKTNDNIKKQLIGRSNRFPRSEKLYVCNLLYDNEK